MNDDPDLKSPTNPLGDHLQPHAKVSFGRRLVNYFLTGLVIAGPIGITVYIAWWLIGLVDDVVKPLIPARYSPDYYLPVHVPGFGLLVAVAFIILLGFFAANLVGRSLVQLGERFFSRLPMISTLYSGLKQIFETVVTQSNKSFKQVASSNIRVPAFGPSYSSLPKPKAKFRCESRATIPCSAAFCRPHPIQHPASCCSSPPVRSPYWT